MGSTLPLILLYQYFNAVLRKITQLIHVDSRKVVQQHTMQSFAKPENKIGNCYAIFAMREKQKNGNCSTLMALNSCKVHTINGCHDKHVKIQ